MFKVILVNFGYSVYEGDDATEAENAAIRSGFEAVITENGKHVYSYSPIRGTYKREGSFKR